MKSTKVKLAPLVALISAAVNPTVAASTVSIDLSYKPRVPAKVLEKAIRDAIAASNTADLKELLIDISSSEIGDAGIDSIIKCFAASSSTLRRDVSLDLMSRMNRLTPEGASTALRQLISSIEKQGSDETSDYEKNKDNPQVDSPSIRSLDLSWNNFHRTEPGAKAMMTDLRKLVENSSKCPATLSLNRCSLGPAAGRSIGKGIVNRYKESKDPGVPFSLHLCGNPELGDAGAAALAAGIRGTKSDFPIFSTLDLSACNIGDAGAEALALALESNPGCIDRLILSDNAISNAGATSIAEAIAQGKTGIEWLELDNNPGIGNAGASSLAEAVGRGKITSLSLRSCEVKADGAKAFGKCLIALVSLDDGEKTVNIDLSGNPLGLLKKKKKESLKSKASTTTASYLNFIGKQIQSGLKDVGWGPTSLESDDEEEARMGEDESTDEPTRCGAKAFASAIVLGEDESHEEKSSSGSAGSVVCKLGMRHCFLDQGAGDALAAAIVKAKERFGMQIVIDAELNIVMEDEMVTALGGSNSAGLEDMMERHMEALEAIRISEARAAQMAAAAAARRQQEWDEDDEEDDFGRMNFGFHDVEEDEDDSGTFSF